MVTWGSLPRGVSRLVIQTPFSSRMRPLRECLATSVPRLPRFRWASKLVGERNKASHWVHQHMLVPVQVIVVPSWVVRWGMWHLLHYPSIPRGVIGGQEAGSKPPKIVGTALPGTTTASSEGNYSGKSFSNAFSAKKGGKTGVSLVPDGTKSRGKRRHSGFGNRECCVPTGIIGIYTGKAA